MAWQSQNPCPGVSYKARFFQDMESFQRLKLEFAKKYFDDVPDEVLTAEPLMYCHFAAGVGESKYMPVSDLQLTAMHSGQILICWCRCNCS